MENQMSSDPRPHITKTVPGTDWVDFDSYACAWGKYQLTCPENRQCQVGLGIVWFGEPAGEKIRFSGQTEVLVLGIGHVNIRVDDGLGPCEVTVWMRSEGTIGVGG